MEKLMIIISMLITYACFGQQELKVQPFLTKIFSQFPAVRDFTMSDTEDEAYFTAQSLQGEISVIMGIKKEKDQWSEPFIAPFSGRHHDLEPFLSSDGLRLYFVSTRPFKDSTSEAKDYDIWYVQRTDKKASWSIPENLGAPINSEHNEYYPSVSQKGNMYFTSDRPGTKGKDDIFISKWENESYTVPVSMSEAINTDGYEFNAFIAPDESFLIFGGYNRPDGIGSGDLYISYHHSDNSWSLAKNLGSVINSDKIDYCPFVSTDGSTLYFTSKRVDFTIPVDGFSTLPELLTEMNKYQNGNSRIYKVPAENLLKGEK